MKKILIQNWKYIFLIIISSQLTIFLSGNIDYTNPIYHNSDFNKYIKMAEASPGITENVIQPFLYRILIPWIAGLLPFSIPLSFNILTILGLAVLSISIFIFLIDNGIAESIALLFTVVFQLNRYFYQFNSWNYFQAGDVFSLAFLFLIFPLLKHKNWISLLLIFSIGLFVKEYVLISIPAAFVFLLKEKATKKDFILFSIISILSILLFVIIRQIIHSAGGESLFVQYTTQVIYYSKPMLLIKRFIIPFVPFGLIPVFFYKKLILFYRNNIHYLIYTFTVIVISFFGEPERLMGPLLAVYFLFIAELVQEYLQKIKSMNFQIFYYAIILVFSLCSSFYHLWGIIRLPDREFTMVLSIILSVLMLFVFILLNRRNLQNY